MVIYIPLQLQSTDGDLSNLLNEPELRDSIVIEFDFVPKSDQISFRYLMAY